MFESMRYVGVDGLAASVSSVWWWQFSVLVSMRVRHMNVCFSVELGHYFRHGSV